MSREDTVAVPAEFASRAWRTDPQNRKRPQPILHNNGDEPMVVPGFRGCPVDFEYYFMNRERFAHGANDWTQWQRLTVRELAMLSLMNTLTDKPNWNQKIFNEEIVRKWRKEALDMPLISEKAWDWCLAELQDKAQRFEATGYVPAFDVGSGCTKSDALISEDIRQELGEIVRGLLDVPEDQKDWHPHSNDQVLNLVHPSLFPLTYGKTRVLSNGGRVDLANILDSCGKGEVACVPKYSAYSVNPEMEFQGEGNEVKITSYINNLHPRNQKLYKLIEKIIGKSIEPWNQVLVYPMQNRTPARIKTYGYSFDPDWPEWATVNKTQLRHKSSTRKVLGDEVYFDLLPKVREYMNLPEPLAAARLWTVDDLGNMGEGEEEEEDELDDRIGNRELERDAKFLDGSWLEDEKAHLGVGIEWKWKRLRRTIHPDPGAYSYSDWKAGHVDKAFILPHHTTLSWNKSPIKNHEYYTIDLAKEWRDKGLQVIVKIASIELTPEKPEYKGGSWHIEGMLNEHIAATSIYYFDSENITESSISFRQEAELDDMLIHYEQSVHEPLCEIFGTTHLSREPKIQTLGTISTPQNRLLVFPNTLQHRVSPFRLVDPTKPGHRRMLVLWLVDPNYRITSTRNVPPQQHDWWAPEAYHRVGIHSRLPRELADMVTKEVGEWPMGKGEAKELREELMAERTGFVYMVDYGVGEYNFCEH
ncbi:hypothetical protein P154DRAFT_614663 [Amniculicola lignicola CBS 123094]|uniref:Uncharacterized protein n=1 Tax=Amniculicola lignicola CBS 123094 TaxID=1392246 RepID=A0A6A5WZJ2_9PLEO|nr:hypothetical protein P154DRAFT_614663 [Amniculicola lignicola CBS 123094]